MPKFKFQKCGCVLNCKLWGFHFHTSYFIFNILYLGISRYYQYFLRHIKFLVFNFIESATTTIELTNVYWAWLPTLKLFYVPIILLNSFAISNYRLVNMVKCKVFENIIKYELNRSCSKPPIFPTPTLFLITGRHIYYSNIGESVLR